MKEKFVIGYDNLVTTCRFDEHGAGRHVVEVGRGTNREACLAIVRLMDGELLEGWDPPPTVFLLGTSKE